MGIKGQNERKCKEYRNEGRELKNRIRKLKKIVKGFKHPEQFKVIESNDTANIIKI